jgi:serine/threonine-protein kinase RsbT
MAGEESAVEVQVLRETDVPLVVGFVRQFCADQGFTPTAAAYVVTAASELANNLWMHADRGGRVRIRTIRSGERVGVELLAEDDGPGIGDVDRAMQEGFSTGGGLGCGLPGVARLMDAMSIDSAAGGGTRITACKWRPERPR